MDDIEFRGKTTFYLKRIAEALEQIAKTKEIISKRITKVEEIE